VPPSLLMVLSLPMVCPGNGGWGGVGWGGVWWDGVGWRVVGWGRVKWGGVVGPLSMSCVPVTLLPGSLSFYFLSRQLLSLSSPSLNPEGFNVWRGRVDRAGYLAEGSLERRLHTGPGTNPAG